MMRFRVIIATAFLLVGFVVLKDDMYPMLTLIAAFYSLTVLYLLVAKSRPIPVYFPYIQMAADILIITCIITVTKSRGGIFLFLYLIPIISAGLYSGVKLSVTVSLGCGLLYSSVILYNYYGGYSGENVDAAPLFYTMFLNLVVFYVVGFLCGYLAKLVTIKGRELSKLQNLYNLILENMNSGLISIDHNGGIIYSNSATEKILGYPVPELKGKNLSELFANVEDGKRKPFDPSIASRRRGYSARQETLGLTKQGGATPIGYNMSEIRDDDGRKIGEIMVFSDLTRVKRLENKLRQAEKLKAVGELAAGIAHEIRNPLASINGSIEMLAESADSSDGDKRLFNVIMKESSRLNDIIEGFLNYARDREPELRRINVREMLEDVLMLMRNDPAFGNRIQISIDIDSSDVEILGDPGQLKQVFINLIKNAAEAILEEGNINVLVSPAKDPEYVEIAVSDNGSGIPQEKLKDIFNPFFTTKSNGMGIGLAVAEKIIRKHGGQISADSVPGEGTTVAVNLIAWTEENETAGAGVYGQNTCS